MNKKPEMSALKAWLLVLASLLDELAVLGLIILILWLCHVEFTWWLILVVVVFILIFGFIMHRAVVPALRRRNLTGAEGMLGMTGEVTQTLNPAGEVKIKGEYWTAKSVSGIIEVGEYIEVTAINGLVLDVKKKEK